LIIVNVAAFPLNVTAVVPVKFDPTSVMMVPIGALNGENEVSIGVAIS